MQAFVIFGRQPKLGLAELESLYGSECIEPIGHVAALVNKDPGEINFARLGGTVKFGKLLTILESSKWKDIETFLLESVPAHAATLEPGKLRLGLSAYELHVGPKDLMVTGLKIKKALKSSGRAARLIPNTMPMLNSAQVLHNHLTGPLGWELLFVRSGDKTYVGQSIAVQDIEAYGARDHGRPMRDAKVGMLPPKLAQIIINLSRPEPASIVLDPFCGTGVVLQESLLMGMHSYGSDLEPRMVEYSRANLDWLQQTNYYQHVCGPQRVETTVKLEVANACEQQWSDFDTIACETYLGRAFSAVPKLEVLQEVMQDVDTIIKKFLKNVASQTHPGSRMAIALPAWKRPTGSGRAIDEDAMQGADEQRTEPYTKYGEGAAEAATQQRASSDGGVSGSARKNVNANGSFWHLPVLDHLEELGYTRSVFKNASNEDLIYHREGQIVGRELVVLTRK